MTKNGSNANKQFNQSEKAKRGWWASVVFMLMIIALIIFLSYVKIVEENRDILIGIIGMLTGSISSMLGRSQREAILGQRGSRSTYR